MKNFNFSFKMLSIVFFIFLLNGCKKDEGFKIACTIPEKCSDVIESDECFVDNFPANLSEQFTTENVADIEAGFNAARKLDLTITKELKMPSQTVWDGWDDQKKALFLINSERFDRGLKPFDGINDDVKTVAQNYAKLLFDKGKFSHSEDENSWDRLERVPVIKEKSEYLLRGENLHLQAYYESAVANAVYGWLYWDGPPHAEHGHRKALLAKFKDNSGDKGTEGLIGIGIAKGDTYTRSGYEGKKTALVVMNMIDPGSTWDHSTTTKLPLCLD